MLMLILMRIRAAVTLQKVVALLHDDGEVSYHIARRTPYGMECRAFGSKCLLLSDGGFKGPSWVELWRAV